MSAFPEPSESLESAAKTYLKDTQQPQLFMQIISRAYKENALPFLEQFLLQMSKKVGKNADVFWLLFAVRQKLKDNARAAESLKQLFMLPFAKSEEMYEQLYPCLILTQQPADTELAVRWLAEGVAAFPRSSILWRNHAEALQYAGEFAAHQQVLENAAKALPDDAAIAFALGVARMKNSGLREGFDGYARRFELPDYDTMLQHLPWPRWCGEPLAGKSLYVYGEQGIGDVLMWLGMVSWLIAQGAKVTLAVDDNMMSLVARSFPAVNVVKKFHALMPEGMIESYDFHLPMGDLMQQVLPHYTPAKHPACLKVDAAKRDALRAAYLAQNPKATKLIGISWATEMASASRRNIPLELFRFFAADASVQLVNLQYDRRMDEVAAYEQRNQCRIITDRDIDPKEHREGFAVQIAAMDEIITAQNSTAHFGGALGVPTTLLIHSYSCWRWGLENVNHWYGSVNVCRRGQSESWKQMISRIAKARG